MRDRAQYQKMTGTISSKSQEIQLVLCIIKCIADWHVKCKKKKKNQNCIHGHTVLTFTKYEGM